MSQAGIEQRSVCAGSYRKMHAEGGSGGHALPPVQAVCACLTHLFLMVEQLVAKHKGLQQLQIQIVQNVGTKGQQKADSPEDLEQLMSIISTISPVTLLFTISAKAVHGSYLCLQSVTSHSLERRCLSLPRQCTLSCVDAGYRHFSLCSINKSCEAVSSPANLDKNMSHLHHLLSLQHAGLLACVHQVLSQRYYILHSLRTFSSSFAYADIFLDGFALITANEAMVEGLRGQGHAWCIHDNCPGSLQQVLAYLTTNRVMPSTSIEQIQQCFEVTEVCLFSC